jgi:protocatechuate 3,4-dioxygenase beta subunit
MVTMNHSTDDDPRQHGVDLGRRKVLLAGLGGAVAAILAACGRGGGKDTTAAAQTGSTATTASAPASTTPTTATAATTATTGTTGTTGTTLAPTPACADDDDVTPAQTEGPYFKPNSPERTNIRADAGGTKLVLTGTVVTTACKPVAKALVDFWQADNGGNYDNSGFGFRGHQFTDAQGRYTLETVVPGLYPGRTRHIHVKVQAPGGRILTSQLYFPGEPRNASDGIYSKELEVSIRDTSDGRSATYGFVLDS